MSSAASLDCVSGFTSHLTHKQHTEKHVLWILYSFPVSTNIKNNKKWELCLMLCSYFLQRYTVCIFITTLCLQQMQISWSQNLSCFTLTPSLFPHLILDSRPVCVSCFHLPTNHSHTSPVDKVIQSTAQSSR